MFSFFLSGVVGECYYSFSGGAWWYNGKKRDSIIKYIVFFCSGDYFMSSEPERLISTASKYLQTFFQSV